MRLSLPARPLFVLGLVGPVALVSIGVVLTLFYNIAACPLCILQRMLYLAIALISALGLAFLSRTAIRILAALSITAIAAGGVSIAGYQIYLQHHPFAASCGNGTAGWERVIELAGQMLPSLFRAEGLCSDDTWTMFGLSIPELSLLAFCGLFVLGLLALFSRRQNP